MEFKIGEKVVRLENVKQAYNGKNGLCCCGCSGKHFDKGIDDVGLAKVFKMFMKNQDLVEDLGDGCYSLELTTKLYCLYTNEGGAK